MPAAPVEIALLPTEENGGRIALDDDVAYLTTSFHGLRAVDVSDPTTPTLLGRIGTRGSPAEAQIVDGYAFVVDFNPSGLRVIDLADPTRPEVVGGVDLWATRELEVVRDVAFVTADDGLRVIDISDPIAPAEIGSYTATQDPYGLAVHRGVAYLAMRVGANGRLELVDVRNPRAPLLLGSIDFYGAGLGVVLDPRKRIAYVAAGIWGLRVFDVSDPHEPREIGNLDTPGIANQVAHAEDTVYVADFYGGLRVIDVSDPTEPRERGFLSGSSGAS